MVRRNGKSRGHAAEQSWHGSYWDGPYWHGPFWHGPYYVAPYWHDLPLVTCCNCGVTLSSCPHGFMCDEDLTNATYEDRPKKKRKPKKSKNEKKSDEKTLGEREEEAKKVLQSLGVDYDAFDICQALHMHQQKQRTPPERLAFRASIAAKSICAQTDEEKKLQFEEFVQNMDRALEAFENPIKVWLRSVFLKAAHHRMDPYKHTAKNMQQ